ncbi:augmin complex subunit dgt6-like [Contarinia nasturtii]|uniref:augmin complex subunit dgt6-like n=1 Tax=Contarinia nasturtii TaxID=265458 RepID=UPI0012D42188|nr:augmin complex subunit dgt6-like [Contarinia nasturtii]
MDRTTIMQGSMNHSIKKSNESQKFTESFLCDEIHDNFRTLALIYPFSDDFRDTFEKGMFIKPNAKAFPHVMKYLFMICDPTDFKKKFCWPIYNKAAEATFRNSTLELLTKLNTKHELGLVEVKNKILIFPGGMEFMRVIYELTRLAMQITLKRNGVHDLENQRPTTLATARKRLDDLENLYKFVIEFKKNVEEHTSQLKIKTDALHQLLKTVTINTNITPDNILHDKFTESWEHVQNDIIERGIQPDVERVTKFQNDCQKLEEKIDAIFEQQTIKFDRNALAAFSAHMQKQYPQLFHKFASIVENGHINLDHMLQALPLAIPSMLQLIESHKPRSVDAMAYESNRLRKISQKADEVLQRTLQLCEPTDCERKDHYSDIIVTPRFENIQSMILSTPTISHDAVQRAEGAAMKTKRLSLFDDVPYLRPATSVMSVAPKTHNSILEESIRSGHKQFLSPTCLFSKESKTKLDPMSILRSLTKKEKKDKNANGNLKPKSMNLGLRFGLGGVGSNRPHELSKINDTMLSVPDFSSTLLNQSNEIKDTLLNVNEQINTSLAKSIDKNGHSAITNNRKRNSFLTGDIFENSDRDINSSPSGRIEPLVTMKLNVSGVKPLKFLDNQNSKLSLSGIEPIEEKLSNANEMFKCMASDIDLNNIENNQNAPNRHRFNLNSMIDVNDESLILNMSDHILTNLDDSLLT